MKPATVASAIHAALSRGLGRLDTHLLLGAVLCRTRSWLLAHDDAAVDADQLRRFGELCDRRADGEPVAYLLGEKEFRGLDLRVDRDVLIPRPDTETLVDWAIELLARGPARPEIVDLGTGSGAIALAVALDCPGARVCGVDLSAPALAVARANGERLGLAVEWLGSDWWEALGDRRFDLVLANPPYIAADDPHLAALRHEPRLALTPGGDGLDALRIIVEGAPRHLRPGRSLLLEHGHDQGPAVRDSLRAHGFEDIATRSDLAGRERCTTGRLPDAS